jgi:hypothetical protein
LTLRAENLFTRRNRLLLSKREKWNALEAAFGKGFLIGGDPEMLTLSPEEIFVRFERLKTVWFELDYVESYRRFLGFRCKAFEENPDWQLIYAATLPEAKRSLQMLVSTLQSRESFLINRLGW